MQIETLGLASAASGSPVLGMPTGWFHVAWSGELVPGAVKPMRYFGCDLVMYRGESGRVSVFDAFCPHLGAHLGYGGTVAGDDIVCGFHGWRWGCDGRNVDIPYSARPNRSQTLRSWHVREIAGLVLVWHNAEGGDPTWEWEGIAEADDPQYHAMYPQGINFWEHAPLHPQYLTENVTDLSHFKFVHKAADVGRILNYEADQHQFTCEFELIFGGGKDATWLTPKGAVTGTIEGRAWGLGLQMARFRGMHDAIQVIAATPIDAVTSDVRASTWVRRLPGDTSDDLPPVATRLIAEQNKQVDRDVEIWSHMRYNPRAAFAAEEARPYNALRKWTRQFYPRGSPIQEVVLPDQSEVSQ